jgi:hypothetical protein
MNKGSPKKTKSNEIRDEYDFATMKNGIRGKYVQRRTRAKRG